MPDVKAGRSPLVRGAAVAFCIGFVTFVVFGELLNRGSANPFPPDRLTQFFMLSLWGCWVALVWLGIYGVTRGRIVRSRGWCITIGALLPYLASLVSVIGVYWVFVMLQYYYWILPIGGLGGEAIWRLCRRLPTSIANS